jgi:hypothetical protein
MSKGFVFSRHFILLADKRAKPTSSVHRPKPLQAALQLVVKKFLSGTNIYTDKSMQISARVELDEYATNVPGGNRASWR